MRLLWLVNIPFPEVRKRIGLPAAGGSGFWMVELMEGLRNRDMEIHVCWSGRQCGAPFSFEAEGTVYHCAPENKYEELGLVSSGLLRYWTSVADRIQPDLLEFHGTEKYHGLLTERMDIPALVEIQGVLNALVRHYFGPLGPLERFGFRHLCRQYLSYVIRSLRERRIFRTNNAFVGRSDWDRKILGSMNPRAHYFTCPRIVREPFRRSCWNPAPSDGEILFVSTASAKPLKGADLPVKAIAELKKKGIEARLALVGRFPEGGYGGWLRELAMREGVSDSIDFMGYTEPEEMIRIYSRSRAFILPSYIENSPNALVEAMCHGMPSIASNVGGIGSIIDDGSTGMLFPRGDHMTLATSMERVLTDPKTAEALGAEARRTSLGSHDPGSVCNRMADIYAELLNGSK